jgi:peroxiredoxin
MSMSDSEQPLSFTVHNVGDPPEDPKSDSVRTRSGRLRLLLLLIICASPVVASYFTYYVVQPHGAPRFGQLIQPSRAMPDVQATNAAGQAVALSALRKQWLLVSVDSGACDSACRDRLYYQRQILAGLGKERERTDWVWLVSDEQPIPSDLHQGLSEATVLRVKPEVLTNWFQVKDVAELRRGLFLVDPMGEWMMRFPSVTQPEEAKQVRRDLERLLRASSSWDTAGR